MFFPHSLAAARLRVVLGQPLAQNCPQPLELLTALGEGSCKGSVAKPLQKLSRDAHPRSRELEQLRRVLVFWRQVRLHRQNVASSGENPTVKKLRCRLGRQARPEPLSTADGGYSPPGFRRARIKAQGGRRIKRRSLFPPLAAKQSQDCGIFSLAAHGGFNLNTSAMR